MIGCPLRFYKGIDRICKSMEVRCVGQRNNQLDGKTKEQSAQITRECRPLLCLHDTFAGHASVQKRASEAGNEILQLHL